MVSVPRFNNLYGIKKLLELDMDGKTGIRSSNNDRVYAFTGGERKGKSNLALLMFEYWYKHILKVKDYSEEYIRFFTANKKEFVNGLKLAPKYHFVMHDESLKDLYARNSISNFNKDLNTAYFIIAGLNLMTGLACPSILDLDSQFRKRRITGMFHVYSRGKVAYYGRRKLNKLIPALAKMHLYSSRPDPKDARDLNGRLITPDFTDTFPKYKGILLKKYLERKESNMNKMIDELVTKYGSDDEEGVKKKAVQDVADLYYDQVKELCEKGLNKKQMQEKTGLGYRALHKIVLQVKSQERYDRMVSSNIE